MRLAAYVLLADAAWLEASILSYYDAVDKIVASYDEEYKGWSGVPVPVDECIRRLKAIDHERKVVWLPGRYRAAPGCHLMHEETAQRQAALDLAAEGSDWVLQIDCDEVVSDLTTLVDRISEAHRAGASGLEYPARYLNVRIGGRWYLEYAQRYGRTWPVIPGPIAVRQTARLQWARQISGKSLRCSWQNNGSSLAAITKSQAIIHLAMIRTPEAMQWKSEASGHAADVDWGRRLAEWRSATRNPLWAMIESYLRRDRQHQRLARIKLKLDPAYLPSGVEGK